MRHHLAVAMTLFLAAPAAATEVLTLAVTDQANGVLTILGLTATPDSTTSALAIQSDRRGDPQLRQTQFGGAFTLSEPLPIYLEGFIGAATYDPTFVLTEGARQTDLHVDWTGIAATGGIGWDFALTDTLTLRPIINLSIGYITSDLNLARPLEDGADVGFLDDGELYSGGLGGSVMLDYELDLEAYEVDVELRYTNLHFETLSISKSDVKGSSSAQTVGLWSRLRWPIGVAVAGRPLRWVAEAAHSQFFGPQADVLGFDYLTQVGGGIELDTTADDILVTRTRLVARYLFGNNARGVSLGIGISF